MKKKTLFILAFLLISTASIDSKACWKAPEYSAPEESLDEVIRGFYDDTSPKKKIDDAYNKVCWPDYSDSDESIREEIEKYRAGLEKYYGIGKPHVIDEKTDRTWNLTE